MLRDDAFEVLVAYLRKQIAAAALDVLGVKNRARAHRGDNRAQELLSREEW
jgi:hypothetical protein